MTPVQQAAYALVTQLIVVDPALPTKHTKHPAIRAAIDALLVALADERGITLDGRASMGHSGESRT